MPTRWKRCSDKRLRNVVDSTSWKRCSDKRLRVLTSGSRPQYSPVNLVVFDLDELALCTVNVRDGPILQRRSQLLAPAGLPAVAADQLGLVHSWFALILARNLLAFPAK